MKKFLLVKIHCKNIDALVANKYRSNVIDVGAVDFPVATVKTKLVLHAKRKISMREIRLQTIV